MKRNVWYLVVATSVVMTLAAVSVTFFSVPLAVALPAMIAAFAFFAYVLTSRKPSPKASDKSHEIAVSKTRLIWLSVPLVLGAGGALASALREGWSVGDTIGACVFVALSLMIIYETARRNRNAGKR